ncbi:Scr1 family TA system antitoxin-like transcriptional regulator [Fodinicola acaciae]|uniref:Scr1 family TA system antitoxin-like transcriptional regulator n=1 Tax=Fodinicola acaciae TaxID=2681555 RepID=UPI0031B614FF
MILRDSNKEFRFLLTEPTVRWRLCDPSIMAAQLDHLTEVSRLPNIRIGVIPLTRQVPHGAFDTFVPYDRRLVTIELFSGRVVLRDPKDIDHYRDLFDFFSEYAVWDNEARGLLETLADDFRSGK